MRYFRCACCGEGFYSNLPPNPQRDTGYGHCQACRDSPRLKLVFEKQIDEYRKEGGTGLGHGAPVPEYA